MREYNRDQLEAFLMVRRHLASLPAPERAGLQAALKPYLGFRAEVSEFQQRFFSGVCTEKCFTSRHSACCGRDGIAVFFADVAVQSLMSSEEETDGLVRALREDPGGFKCVYLGVAGCLWRIKPIVCEMFLCDHAKEAVLGRDSALRARWSDLCSTEKQFTWPDRPVLFDELEEVFIRAGLESPLMYFHRSPGLLRVKSQSSPSPHKTHQPGPNPEPHNDDP
jgi:hypothetical protein